MIRIPKNVSIPYYYLFSRIYHTRIIDHYENPRNVGSFPPSDPNVGTGLCLSIQTPRASAAAGKAFVSDFFISE